MLDQFSHVDSLRSLRQAFYRVGASQPVTLSRKEKGELLEVIEFWAEQTRGGYYPELPEGIFELRNALHDDLHDTAS